MSPPRPSALAPLLAPAPRRVVAPGAGGLGAPLLRGLFLAAALGLPIVGGTLGTWLDGGPIRSGVGRPAAGLLR